MAIKKHNRQYDLVVLGATGYTGRLTAYHIAQHLPTDLKWAVAGRSEAKLQRIVDECRSTNTDRLPPGIEVASIDDYDQLEQLAKKTCVLITTVGPYVLYGEQAFRACAETGTHYLDVTGEAPWVRRMIKKYEATAKETGALMFPQSGLESSPADLCTWALAQHIRENLGVGTRDVNLSIHSLKSAPSGGTLATALVTFEQFSRGELVDAMKPYALSPIPHPEPGRPPTSLTAKIFGSRQIPGLGHVTTSVAAWSNVPIVERSWGLLSEAPGRKHEFYGPNFRYAEHFRALGWLHAVLIHWALIIFAVFLSLSPVRTLVRRFIYQPGQGPPLKQAKKDKIEFRAVAVPDTKEPSKKQAFCRAWYEGSMYYLSGLFLAEAALTILEDDLHLEGGVYTPACLGQGFLDRADAAGFNVVVKMLDV
ncbi:putative trans-acting enoyl reductase [Paramyrothecium foliicola]|nr:putative trans-acting enoyl reductase [Paramyrothecium foliicola]